MIRLALALLPLLPVVVSLALTTVTGCSRLPFQLANSPCSRNATAFDLFVFRGGPDVIGPILETLIAVDDWPTRLDCEDGPITVDAVFCAGGLLPRPGAVEEDLPPLFQGARSASSRMSHASDWIGLAVRHTLAVADGSACVATFFAGMPHEVALSARCLLPHWGTEMLSLACDPARVDDPPPAAASTTAWRLEMALLETAVGPQVATARSRSDKLMGVLLELQGSKPGASLLESAAGAEAGSSRSSGRSEGSREIEQRRRNAFHRRVLSDFFPETASALLEADGSTLRTDLRVDAAYAPVLLEAAVGHLTRGVPGLKWILEPVMYAVMKPVLNNFVNLAAPTLGENMQEELQHRMVEQVPTDTAMIAANGIAPQLASAVTDALSSRLARSLSASLVASVGGSLKKSLPPATSRKAAAELTTTVTNRAVASLTRHLLEEMPGHLSKALTATLARSLPPALTATLTAALRPLHELRLRASVAAPAIGAAGVEACGRCSDVAVDRSVREAACRICDSSHESVAELADAMRDEGDAMRDEGDRASHHYGSFYAGYYAMKTA